MTFKKGQKESLEAVQDYILRGETVKEKITFNSEGIMLVGDPRKKGRKKEVV